MNGPTDGRANLQDCKFSEWRRGYARRDRDIATVVTDSLSADRQAGRGTKYLVEVEAGLSP